MKRLLVCGGLLILAAAAAAASELHQAAWQCNLDEARQLIQAGVPVGELDDQGDLPLGIAALQGSADIVRLLLEAGADVNARDRTGCTPLHQAVRSSNLDVIRLLLERGADVNLRNALGETPLDLAAVYKKKEIIKLLKNRGGVSTTLEQRQKDRAPLPADPTQPASVPFTFRSEAEYKAFEKAAKENTRDAYARFAATYPKSELAAEARRRIDDPVHGLLVTCQSGTEKALRGFVASHPAGFPRRMAEAYLELLDLGEAPELESVRRFAATRPANPFGPVALELVPLIWLRERRSVVGVQILIGGLVFKGLLGGSSDEEKVAAALWERLQAELSREGVKAVVLPGGDMDAPPAEVTHTLKLSYFEEGRSSTQIGDPPIWKMATLLSDLLARPHLEHVMMTLRRADTGTPVFGSTPSLSHLSAIEPAEAFAGRDPGTDARLAYRLYGLRGRALSAVEEQQIIREFFTSPPQ